MKIFGVIITNEDNDQDIQIGGTTMNEYKSNLINNARHLIELSIKKDQKEGKRTFFKDYEEKLGKSKGFIAKYSSPTLIQKGGIPDIGIDFIVRLSKMTGISESTLLHSDLTKITDEDKDVIKTAETIINNIGVGLDYGVISFTKLLDGDRNMTSLLPIVRYEPYTESKSGDIIVCSGGPEIITLFGYNKIPLLTDDVFILHNSDSDIIMLKGCLSDGNRNEDLIELYSARPVEYNKTIPRYDSRGIIPITTTYRLSDTAKSILFKAYDKMKEHNYEDVIDNNEYSLDASQELFMFNNRYNNKNDENMPFD